MSTRALCGHPAQDTNPPPEMRPSSCSRAPRCPVCVSCCVCVLPCAVLCVSWYCCLCASLSGLFQVSVCVVLLLSAYCLVWCCSSAVCVPLCTTLCCVFCGCVCVLLCCSTCCCVPLCWFWFALYGCVALSVLPLRCCYVVLCGGGVLLPRVALWCCTAPCCCCVSLCSIVLLRLHAPCVEPPRAVVSTLGAGRLLPPRAVRVHKAERWGAVPGTQRATDRPHGAALGGPARAVLLAGGRGPAPGVLEQLQPQVPGGRLHSGGPAQRLPGHHLPALRGGQRDAPRHGALHPLPGGVRGVCGLQTPLQGADPLGVQQAGRPARPRAVLGEVPALHALHPGQGVQGGTQLLLHLKANSPPWRRLPEAEGDCGWQSHWDAARPHPNAEGGDPGR